MHVLPTCDWDGLVRAAKAEGLAARFLGASPGAQLTKTVGSGQWRGLRHGI
jgi:hypothetical protein